MSLMCSVAPTFTNLTLFSFCSDCAKIYFICTCFKRFEGPGFNVNVVAALAPDKTVTFAFKPIPFRIACA